MKTKPKILFYDIETTPLKAWVWRLGKQVIRHHQLDEDYSSYGIICISYCWNDGKPAKTIGWGYRKQDTASVIEKFDKVIRKADITIGKNNRRFDVKHINTQRWLAGLEPLPDWAAIDDDLESQIRKHFYLPSNSLDYLSHICGLGGKNKMEFSDWIHIVEQTDSSKYKKMCDYCETDVEHTRTLFEDIAPYVKPRLNMATFLGNQDGNYLRCRHCGGTNIYKNGTDNRYAAPKQKFYCRDCRREAGKATIMKSGKLGKVQ